MTVPMLGHICSPARVHVEFASNFRLPTCPMTSPRTCMQATPDSQGASPDLEHASYVDTRTSMGPGDHFTSATANVASDTLPQPNEPRPVQPSVTKSLPAHSTPAKQEPFRNQASHCLEISPRVFSTTAHAQDQDSNMPEGPQQALANRSKRQVRG